MKKGNVALRSKIILIALLASINDTYFSASIDTPQWSFPQRKYSRNSPTTHSIPLETACQRVGKSDFCFFFQNSDSQFGMPACLYWALELTDDKGASSDFRGALCSKLTFPLFSAMPTSPGSSI